jgi:hypothetical protein
MTEPSPVQPNTTDTPPENVRTVSLDDDTKPVIAKISLKERLRNLFKRKKNPELPTKPGKFKLSKRGKIILAVIVGLLVVMGVYTGFIGLRLKAQASEAQTHARGALDAFKSQNLPGAESELVALQGSIDALQQTYGLLVFYKFMPLARGYYLDGEHALNAADAGIKAGTKAAQEITPYADVLGFQGEGSFAGGTAEDRIRLIIETLDKIMPSFDEIAQNLQVVNAEISAINPKRYPKSFRGMPVREQIAQTQATLSNAVEGFIGFRPVLEQLPDLAGGKGERKKYLILFQNDNELRPTGGFLTAYAVVFVENGKVTPEKSDDIYELDQKFTKRLPIPDALGKYLTTEQYWHLRDMNISPDFKDSMDQFFEHYQEVRGEPSDINGIIAVDTVVLTDLLRILGPVQVGGGTFSAEPEPRCDGCAQVVYALSEIITRPTPFLREDRKGILGPLMQATLQKAYSAPKELWPQLFEMMWQDLEGRHIQMYFLEESKQAAAEAVNGAGRLMAPTDGHDFLAIVDANLGGAKSNLFTQSEVKQTITSPENGQLTKTVEITYKNIRRADNCNLEAGQLCLNGTLRDWSRLYLPLGAKLIEAQGFTADPSVYEENGLTVIDGFFILEPLGTAKLRLTYTVPYTDEETYRIELWKQGGIDPFPTLFDVNGGEEQVEVAKDTLVEIPF